jgi:transposase
VGDGVEDGSLFSVGELPATLGLESESSGVKPRKRHVRSAVVYRKSPGMGMVPLDLESRIPAGDPARWVKSALSELDLSILGDLYEDHGGVSYDPRSMLAGLILGCCVGVLSEAGLERAFRLDVSFIYVADGITPDDRTIGRFKSRLGPKLDDLWKSLHQARKKNGGGVARVGIDGTKLRSASARCRKSPAELEALGLNSAPTSDPDARLVRSPQGFLLGYNVQIAVELDSGDVLATEVYDDSADSTLLLPMLERTSVLTGEVPEEVVADAGYNAAQTFSTCESKEITAYIAPVNVNTMFWTVVDGDILCPMGETAQIAGHGKSKNFKTDKYMVPVRLCRNCPFFIECANGKRGPVLEIPQGCSPVDKVMSDKLIRTPQGKRRMRERLGKVEPVFSRLKWGLGYRRFRTRGLAKVRMEISFILLAWEVGRLGRAFKALLWTIIATYLRIVATWLSQNKELSAGLQS